MRSLKTKIFRRTQSGAATLFVTVIILFATTLVIIYAAKVGLEDIRIAGNNARAKEAFSVAEAGLNRAVAELQQDNSIASTTTVRTGTVTGGGSYNAIISTVTNGYLVTSNGGTADASGNAFVTEKYGRMAMFGSGPDAPLIVGGTMPAVGGMEVITNPNGGGTGVPVSVWTSGPATFSGSGGTCQKSEYLASNSLYPTNLSSITHCNSNACDCTGSTLSSPGNLGSDVIPNDSDFPSDLFAYTFGYPGADWEELRGNPKTTTVDNSSAKDCGAVISAASSGIYWIEGGGTCDIGNAGSEAAPVVLILDETDIKMTGGIVYGIIFSFDNPDKTGTGGGIQLAGNGLIYGSFISDHSMTVSGAAGSFDIRYETLVMSTIANGSDFQIFAKTPGSWLDY